MASITLLCCFITPGVRFFQRDTVSSRMPANLHAAETDTLFSAANVLMFIVGFGKCGFFIFGLLCGLVTIYGVRLTVHAVRLTVYSIQFNT